MPGIDPELRSAMERYSDNDPHRDRRADESPIQSPAALPSSSVFPTKAERRDYVVNELKAFAEARR